MREREWKRRRREKRRGGSREKEIDEGKREL